MAEEPARDDVLKAGLYRTVGAHFLVALLLFWCVEAAAQHGWGALPVVLVTSFALLGSLPQAPRLEPTPQQRSGHRI